MIPVTVDYPDVIVPLADNTVKRLRAVESIKLVNLTFGILNNDERHQRRQRLRREKMKPPLSG
ncbi:Uncharacterised protein [Raoultella terrigena]|uniref:Uncharacterized protein n=1 Tax=Raoultella terrigena TaxID=577 RepID=A0A3P8M2J0_RAOTE|nr:Uncharacterised protein [Raoultella terrigena]